jgi:YD repeat-containing protein
VASAIVSSPIRKEDGVMADEVICIYDDLGRLVGLGESAGDLAIYTYDAVGNILSITRQPSSEPAIVDFSPRTATIKGTIVIAATGVSVVPDENEVTIGGVPADVIEVGACRVVATIPVGAITGPISLSTPTGSATSVVPIVVGPEAKAPAIFSVRPSVVEPGGDLTIDGVALDIAPVKVKINAAFGLIRSMSDSQLVAEVPPVGGSGRVTVVTRFGLARSDVDIFIPPAPRTAADVEFTGRMALGDSAAVTIGTPNRIALVVCDALAGHSLNIGVSEVTIVNQIGIFELSVLSPREAMLARKLMSGQLIDDMAVNSLPETGTYTVVIDPGATPVSLTLSLSEPVTGVLTVDGPPVLVSLERPGQRGQLTFDGSTGQRVSLGVSDVHIGAGSGALSGIKVAILNPDGTLLASKITASDTVIHPEPLPETGNYAIAIDPDRTETVSMTLTLSGQQ